MHNNIFTKINHLSISNIANALVYGFLFIFLFSFILPVNPRMPSVGLDPSWKYVINYSLLENLRFGNDIYFTFGPLGDFWFPQYFYSEETYKIAIFLSFLFSVIVFSSLVFVSKNATLLVKVIGFLAIMFGIKTKGVFLWYIIPILLVQVALLENIKSRFVLIFLLLFFLSFSVLVKFSHFPTAILATLLIDGYFYKKNKIPFYTLSFFTLMILLFVISGQKFSDFFLYFIRSFNILSGYSESMQSVGSNWMIYTFLILSILMLIVLISSIIQSKDIKTYIYVFISAIVLFMSFKNGFVRHDAHALAAYSGLAFVFGLLIIYVSQTLELKNYKLILVYLFCVSSIIMSCIVRIHYSGGSWEEYKRLDRVLYNDIIEIKNRFISIPSLLEASKINLLNSKYQSSIENIKNGFDISDINGTVDIYPWEQSYVIANHLDYRPRPLFQSYSVYTPELIKKNKEFLYSDKAPEYILFTVREIDNRLPSMMEGSSWLDIMSLYSAIGKKGEFLLLKRSKKSKSYKLDDIEEKTVSFNEEVAVPKGFVFSEIHIKKTLFGSMVNTLFKSPILNIELTFENGATEMRRIIPGIASSGFILSPYLDTTHKFFGFSIGKESGESVQSIRLINNPGYGYKDEIKIKFKKIITNNFSADNLPDKLKLMLFYNYITKISKYIDKRLFNVQIYKGKEIVFSHVGVIFGIDRESIPYLEKNNKISFSLGMKEGAYLGNGKSEGACFRVYEVSKSNKEALFEKCIAPRSNVDDRKLKKYVLDVKRDSLYLFEVKPIKGKSAAWGWTYWEFIRENHESK